MGGLAHPDPGAQPEKSLQGSQPRQRLLGLQATRSLAANLSLCTAYVTPCQVFLGLFLCLSLHVHQAVSPDPEHCEGRASQSQASHLFAIGEAAGCTTRLRGALLDPSNSKGLRPSPIVGGSTWAGAEQVWVDGRGPDSWPSQTPPHPPYTHTPTPQAAKQSTDFS